MKLNVQGRLKYWLWRLASLLWSEHKFNWDITDLRNVSMSTSDENIEAVKFHCYSSNHWITIREVADDVFISFGSCQAIFTDVLGMKRLLVLLVLIVKFWAKTTSHIHHSGDVDDIQRWSRFVKKVITGDESWVYGYDIETKPNHPNGSVQKTRDRRMHFEFGQMWRFSSLFSWLQWRGASWIATRSYGQ